MAYTNEQQREAVLHRFDHMPPATDAVANTHAAARKQFKLLAAWVYDNTEVSRERSLVITALQEAMMWTNAAIAMNHPDNVKELGD